MYCCIYNTETKKIDHARFIEPDMMALEWPMYELECLNRGGYWLAYKGEEPYTFPEVKP